MTVSRQKVISLVALCLLILQIRIGNAQQAFSVEPSDTSVTEGATASLACSVTNLAGTVTWTRDSSPVSVGTTIIDTSNTRYTIEGDGSSVYNLQIVNAELSDSGEFQCLVTSGGVGNDELLSGTVTLTVFQVQSFTTQPGDTSVSTETTATLMCQVDNKEGFLSWLKDGVVISNDTVVTNGNARYSIIGDQSAGEYNLNIVSTEEAADQATYQCVVTAAGTSGRIESNIATLTIQGSGQRLTIVPSSSVFVEGTDALMRCKVVDKVGTVSWLQNSQSISYDSEIGNGNSRFSIVGDQDVGEFYLMISDVDNTDVGTYHCIVSGGNSPGNDAISSSGATLTVIAATPPDEGYPLCSISPSTDLREGDNVTISCTSRGGEPQPELVWFRNNAEFSGFYRASDLYARNDVSFRLTNDMIGATFECLSSHPSYTTAQKCELPPLDFELTPTISVSLSLLKLEVLEDETGSVVCTATGDPSVLGYKWFYNGVAIAETDDRFVISDSGTAESTLTITSASLSMDESVVLCEARNRIDTESVYAVVRILEDNLYTIVLAVLALIAIFVFALIIVPIIAYYFYRRHQKRTKVAPLENGPATVSGTKVTSNYFVTEETVPNGNAHKLRRQSSKPKVLDHESVNAGSGKLPELTGNGRYPPLIRSQTPETFPMDRLDSERSGRTGSYDVESAQLARLLHQGTKVKPSSRPSSSRRSSVSPTAPTLSPGEFKVRDDYEKKLRELESMKKSLTDSGMIQEDSKSRKSTREGGEKKKHKHKKRDKDRDDKEHKKSKSKDHKEHRDKKDKKDRKEKKDRKDRKKDSK